MKIEVKERGNNEFYDEFLSVMFNYKKLVNNPYLKIKPLTKSAITLGLISLVMLITFIILFALDSTFKLYLYFISMFSFLVGLSICYYLIIKNRINKLKSVKGVISINIEKDYIEYLSEAAKYKINFNDIKYIIINKHNIAFLPKKPGSVLISLNVKYINEVKESLQKFGHLDLLIDNSNLYK